MSPEAHSRQVGTENDANSQSNVAVDTHPALSRKESIEKVASEYGKAFPGLPFAGIKEPEVLLSLLHHLGAYLRARNFDFHQPYQLEQETLLKDAKATLQYTKNRGGHDLSEAEKQQRLHGWAGEMVVKFLLDVVYECARQSGVTNPPHRHHHNERIELFPQDIKSALHLYVTAKYGAGRLIRFDSTNDRCHQHFEKCEVDLLAGGEDKIYLIDVTTDSGLVPQKLYQNPNSPVSHLRESLARTRCQAFNIVCAVTDHNQPSLLNQDYEGGNFAGTVPVRHQTEKFAQMYLKLLHPH